MYKNESKIIEQVISNYFDGIFYGNVDLLARCFHQEARIYGDIEGAHYEKSIAEYVKGVSERQSPNDLNHSFEMRIIGIELLGNIAMVKVHIPLLGKNYYDYLSLVKFGDDWKIVNKVFTHVA